MPRPHVIGIRQTMIFIETLIGRKKLRVMPQMPFSVYGSRVSFLLTQLRNCHFVRVQAESRSRVVSSIHINSNMQRARHQRSPRCRTYGGTHHEIRKTTTLHCQLIKIRSRIIACPKRPDIRITHVIDKDEHNIRRTLFCGNAQRKRDTANKESGSRKESKVLHIRFD